MTAWSWNPVAGSAFLDGSTDVGLTAADQPQNDSATEGVTNYLICDRTGFRIPVAEGLRTEWTGRMVRRQSWEPRHPQDYVRGSPERIKGSPRPEPDDAFIDPATTVINIG